MLQLVIQKENYFRFSLYLIFSYSMYFMFYKSFKFVIQLFDIEYVIKVDMVEFIGYNFYFILFLIENCNFVVLYWSFIVLYIIFKKMDIKNIY